MFEIPEREQLVWAKTQPNLKTGCADPVVQYFMRREGDSSYSDGFVAFPVASLPAANCVRIDFLTVLTHRYRSEQLGVSADAIGFEVSDSSQFKSQCLEHYPYDKIYDRANDIGPPEVAMRHFSIFFGDYGTIDVLAKQARVATFSLERAGSLDQFGRHAELLTEALKVPWSDEGWPDTV